MIRTWKCLLGTIAVCALLAGQSRAQEIRANQEGVVHLRTDEPLNETLPADWFYGAQESVWVNDFQPPPGIGVDQVTVPQDNNVGYAVTSDVESILYRVYRTQRHFYGLPDSFTSAGAFIPLRVMNGGTSLLAVDPRVFVNDYGQGGINFGLTARRYFASSDRILTSSLWIDYDNGHVGGGYGQVGLYGSIIGRYLTTSAFANIPFGEKQNDIARSLTSNFIGNALALTQTTLVESPYAHYQVEVATPIPYFSRFGFDYGLGVYALASRADGVEDGWGVSNRIQAQVTEDLTVNTLVTSDGVFGSNLSINIQFTLPNGLPSRVLRRKPVRAHLTDPDNRSPRVLTNTVRHIQHFAAIDPKDGQIITVAHIDPNVFGGGTGVNDPFGSVAQFENLPDNIQSGYRIVFVHPRNDGTDTNLNTGITLFDEQKLLGDGINHVIDTTLGPVLLPGVTAGGPTPLLTNSSAPGMDVVTLADWNTVSGFTIDASGGTGDGMDMDAAIAINGRGLQAGEAGDPGVNGFIIDRNVIQNGMFGLVVDSETSGESVGVVTNNEFRGNALGAVDLNYNGTVVAGLTIEDNLIVASSAGVGFLPEMLPVIRQNMGFTTNVLAANDDGSTATAVPLGFMIDFFGLAATDVWVNNNGNITFTGPLFTFTPFDLLSTATPIIAPFFADVDTRNHGMEVTYGQDMVQGQSAFGVNWLDADYFASNTAHGTQLNDFQLVLIDRSDIGSGDFDIEFNYEQILWETGDASGGTNGVGGSSARVGYANGTTTAFELPGSAVNGAFLDGGPMALISNMLNSTLPGRYRFAVRNGVVTTTGTGVGTGISITASDSAVVGAPGMPATFRRNEIEGYDDGLVIRGPGNAVMNWDISDNFINGVGNNGITLITEDDETMTVTGTRNIVINSGANGLAMVSSGNSVMNVSLLNSAFNDNTGRGIKGTAIDNSTMTFDFTTDHMDPLATEDRNGNGVLDPLEDLNGNGVIDPLVAQTSNNESAGIDFAAFDSATLDIDIDDVLVDPNADAGISVLLDGTATATVDVINSTIIDTVDGADPDLAGDGIAFRTLGSSTLTGLVDNNLIDNNSGSGFRSLVDGNSTQTIDVSNNTVTNNAFGLGAPPRGFTVGILLERALNGVLTANVVDNFVDSNQGAGLLVSTDGANNRGPGAAPETQIFVHGNEFTNNITQPGFTTSVGIQFVTHASSVLYTEVVDNVITGNDGSGIVVTTNDNSFFGITPAGVGLPGSPSIFDSNIISDNMENGILLNENDASWLVADIISDSFAAGMADSLTLIERNGIDGIHINTNGSGTTSVRVGNAANPFPDVIINQNADDAIELVMNGTGVVDFSVDNAILTGSRRLGALDDPGITLNYTGDDAATVRVGQDMGADHVIDDANDTRVGVDIYDFGGDGVFVDYNRTGFTGFLDMLVANSRIGIDATRFNGGDGVEINARSDGFTGQFYNNVIHSNGGDGIRMVSLTDVFAGRSITVTPFGQDVDSNNNGIGDQPSAMSPTLLATPGYVFPWGDDSLGAITAFSTIIVGDPGLGARFGGNDISGNFDNGLELSTGAGTLLTARVRGNTMTGNTSADFRTSTADNPNLIAPLSTDNAEGMDDIVVLNPLAHMFLEFGDSSVAGENINIGNILLPTLGGGTIMSNGTDPFKGTSQPILTDYTVVVPNEVFPPADNQFTIFGVDQNEAMIFMNNGWTLMPPGGQ